MKGSVRIGVRAEDKSPWERRAPITPDVVQELVSRHGIEVLVEPSSVRVFRDDEYRAAGAVLTADLSDSGVVFGVKEIPPPKLEPGLPHVFFAHVIKGQPYNMPMLGRLMAIEASLVDYERVVDDEGRRLIFFGRYAGLAGMIDSLWTLGRRLDWEGLSHPFGQIRPAHAYDSLDAAKTAVRAAGEELARDGVPASLAPLVVGVAGYGHVASGVQEILAVLPTVEVGPEGLAALLASPDARRDVVYRVTFREEHLVARADPEQPFALQEYYDHPERYRSRFRPHLDRLTMLVNCIFWSERYPRLVTKEDVRRLFGGGVPQRLRVIGDITCDIEGSIEVTERATTPGAPVYVWDAGEGGTVDGVAGNGPVILAVDALPCELPRESSEDFSRVLAPLVPAIARANWAAPWGQLDLPDEISRAVVVHQGALTPDFRYLEQYLEGAPGHQPGAEETP